MGFFDKMFGGSKDYPQLDPANPAMDRLERFRSELEELSAKANQPLEVIPGDERAFVFIGKPPKKFGIAWVEEGKINNLKTLVDEQHASPQQVQAMADKLKDVYEANQQDERFCTRLGDREIVVTPSDTFRKQVRAVIEQVVS